MLPSLEAHLPSSEWPLLLAWLSKVGQGAGWSGCCSEWSRWQKSVQQSSEPGSTGSFFLLLPSLPPSWTADIATCCPHSWLVFMKPSPLTNTLWTPQLVKKREKPLLEMWQLAQTTVSMGLTWLSSICNSCVLGTEVYQSAYSIKIE